MTRNDNNRVLDLQFSWFRHNLYDTDFKGITFTVQTYTEEIAYHNNRIQFYGNFVQKPFMLIFTTKKGNRCNDFAI